MMVRVSVLVWVSVALRNYEILKGGSKLSLLRCGKEIV